MARIAALLDEEVAYGFKGGAEYSVNVSDLENRFEERDENWMYPKHRYSASFENLDDDVKEVMIHTLHACRGRFHSFLMRDWNDYSIVDQEIAVLPGTADPIQLYKKYQPPGWPAYTIRPIQAVDTRQTDTFGQPVQPFQIVDSDGNPVAGTLDSLTGLFTPDAEWGNGAYFLTCDFLVWVRMDHDDNQMTINGWRDHTVDVEMVEDPFEFEPANLPPSWDGA